MMPVKRSIFLIMIVSLLCAGTVLAGTPQAAFRSSEICGANLHKAKPFQDNNGRIPGRSVYDGPLFELNHAWPTTSPPVYKNLWREDINKGRLTTANAAIYAAALKKAVAKNAKQLIMHYDNWDAAKAGWYNQPWLGSVREAIHGSYSAGLFGPSNFPGTGLRTKFDTHVVTYYNPRAAYTVGKFWNESAMKPTLTTAAAQFPEGSIVVKAAVFASTDRKQLLGWWTAMEGAQVWKMYLTPKGKDKNKDCKTPSSYVWPGYVAQLDIIIKDSQLAPETGWVYMTLVYNANAKGNAWDKMVPLGMQWGNDPQATKAGDPLKQTWINPNAPKYATQTLGWGGRLSGPNDGARNDIVVNGKLIKNTPDSSCMSCHSTAQWNVKRHRMDSFLLPSYASANKPGFKLCNAQGQKPGPDEDSYICSPAPGSTAWMKWFQNRLGTEPMDKGSIAMDFDEVFSFKALKLWWMAVGPADQPVPMLFRHEDNSRRFNQYTGAPLTTH